MSKQSGYPLYFHRTLPMVSEDSSQVAELFQSYFIHAAALHKLPPLNDDFTGRLIEIARVVVLIEQLVYQKQVAPIVITITGRAGSGKSALAIHLAHELKSYFPDAQLYADFRGTEQTSTSASGISASLLRAQGVVPEKIPEQETAWFQTFQASLVDKHTILVLDNVVDVAQVLPLIPSHSASVVLITSRQSFPQLDPALALELSELSQPEAIELLHRLMNWDIAPLAPSAEQELVELCDCLPLSIHLLSGLLKQQLMPLTDYVRHLRQQRQRIDQLRTSYPEVRSVFMLAQAHLSEQSARLLRLLSLLTIGHFSLSCAISLLEVDLNTASQAVGQLADFKLIHRTGGGHYRIAHDLVRSLARGQLAGAESAESRQLARLRISQWYSTIAGVMAFGLDTSVPDWLLALPLVSKKPAALSIEQYLAWGTLNWFEMEQWDLFNAVEWALQAEAWEIVLEFAERLAPVFDRLDRWQDWLKLHRGAIDAARKLGKSQQEAYLLTNLANGYCHQHLFDQAQIHYDQSLTLLNRLGDTTQAARTLMNYGVLWLQQGDQQLALEYWQAALAKLPETASERRQIKRWIQTISLSLWQKISQETPDQPASEGFLRSMGNALKRFIFE